MGVEKNMKRFDFKVYVSTTVRVEISSSEEISKFMVEKKIRKLEVSFFENNKDQLSGWLIAGPKINEGEFVNVFYNFIFINEDKDKKHDYSDPAFWVKVMKKIEAQEPSLVLSGWWVKGLISLIESYPWNLYFIKRYIFGYLF